MAAATRRRSAHSLGFFSALNNLSNADFCTTTKKRRRTMDGGKLYSVDRVIAFRKLKEDSIFCWLYFVGIFCCKLRIFQCENLSPQLRDDGRKILMLSIYLILDITKFSLEVFKLLKKIGRMYHRKVYTFDITFEYIYIYLLFIKIVG